jgi:hypothetical protein
MRQIRIVFAMCACVVGLTLGLATSASAFDFGHDPSAHPQGCATQEEDALDQVAAEYYEYGSPAWQDFWDEVRNHCAGQAPANDYPIWPATPGWQDGNTWPPTQFRHRVPICLVEGSCNDWKWGDPIND